MSIPRLLFASYHCFIDPSSGAAIATRDLLEGLHSRGWSTKVLTGPAVDFEKGESPAQLLADQHIPFEEKKGRGFFLLHFQTGGVPATIFQSGKGGALPPNEAKAFLALYDRILETFQPNVLLTYGGQAVGWEMMKRARERGIRVVFALHNYAYRDAGFFKNVDSVLVPSKFCADYYRKGLGLSCVAIPSPMIWSRILCERESPQYVTFVNPQPHKGVFVFARIAYELAQCRPDIPLLVVEGRSQANWLARSPLDLSGLKNLNVMPNTPDPRDFYRLSRIMLMPSLWNESFGRVAAESLINGIPVLASNRGSLPEVLAETGHLFDIPAQYTPCTTSVPNAKEVAPWIETIIRLWHDKDFYHRQSQLCQAVAQKWQPDEVFSQHDQFFREFCK